MLRHCYWTLDRRCAVMSNPRLLLSITSALALAVLPLAALAQPSVQESAF